MINPWVAIGVSAAVFLSGGVIGGAAADWKAERRIQTCATEISRLRTTTKCPQPLIDALNSVSLTETKKQIEYRDRMVPLLVDGSAEAARQNAQLLKQIEELRRQENTYACAASPAFERRRLQLCDQEGGPDCPAASAGAADAGSR